MTKPTQAEQLGAMTEALERVSKQIALVIDQQGFINQLGVIMAADVNSLRQQIQENVELCRRAAAMIQELRDGGGGGGIGSADLEQFESDLRSGSDELAGVLDQGGGGQGGGGAPGTQRAPQGRGTPPRASTGRQSEEEGEDEAPARGSATGQRASTEGQGAPPAGRQPQQIRGGRPARGG